MAYVKHCSYMHLNVGDTVCVPGLDLPFVVKEKESVSGVDLFHDQLGGVPKVTNGHLDIRDIEHRVALENNRQFGFWYPSRALTVVVEKVISDPLESGYTGYDCYYLNKTIT